MSKIIKLMLVVLSCLLFSPIFSQKYTETKKGELSFVANQGGQTLGFAQNSGVKILTIDGFAFKDLNKNGKLDKYEDWRLPVDVRAKDLATQLSIEQIAGLMLYSRQIGRAHV